MKPWVLYGATGVTGRLILDRALSRGLRPMLIGRNAQSVRRLAEPCGLRAIAASLDNQAGLCAALSGQSLVLNAAGPFATTGAPLIQAALSSLVTYLDINGELAALQLLFSHHDDALKRRVALIGGAGFGVAATDGLAMQLDERLGGAEWLRISIKVESAFGSDAVAASTLEAIAGGGREVRSGRLAAARLARCRWIEVLPDGTSVSFASAPLAELVAVNRTVQASRIVAGVPMAPGQAIAVSLIAPLLPMLLKIPAFRAAMAHAGGHSAAADATGDHHSMVCIEGGRGGRRHTARLVTGEGFAAAAEIAVAAVEAALTRDIPPGAHSPATAFGSRFIDAVPGMNITLN